MNASLLAVLNDAERLLVAETERAELAALDEDAAIDWKPGSGAHATNTSVSTAGRAVPGWPNTARGARHARRTSGPP